VSVEVNDEKKLPSQLTVSNLYCQFVMINFSLTSENVIIPSASSLSISMLSRSSSTLLHRLTRPSTLLLASSSLAFVYVASTPSIYNSLATTFKLGQSNSMSSSSHDYPVKKSEEEWRLQLNPEQFRVSSLLLELPKV
jgi:hypothetical protein